MIRHGETVMNAKRLTCGGGIDTELNPTGLAQAQKAALVLNALPEKPTLIITSGMVRTRQTAEILNAQLGLPIIEDQDLREHMMGEWEGKHWDYVFPRLRAGEKPQGGEDHEEFGARVGAAFKRNLSEHASERVLFVGHGGTFHSFQRIQGQIRPLFVPNAALHRFDPEPKHQPMPWRAVMYEWRDGIRESVAQICPSLPPAEQHTHGM